MHESLNQQHDLSLFPLRSKSFVLLFQLFSESAIKCILVLLLLAEWIETARVNIENEFHDKSQALKAEKFLEKLFLK